MDKNMKKKNGGKKTKARPPAMSEKALPAINRSRGLAPIEEEDRILPRLKLLQALSPEVLDKKGSPGEFVNSISGENFGSEVSFIPLFWRKSRILWIPREDGGGIRCRSFDGRTSSAGENCLSCENRLWKTEGKERIQPECVSFINLITLVQGNPVAISFGKTSYSAGKKFINLVTLKGVDIFSFLYTLISQETTTEKGRFYIMRIDDPLKKPGDEILGKAEAFFERLMEIKPEIHEEDEKGEEETKL